MTYPDVSIGIDDVNMDVGSHPQKHRYSRWMMPSYFSIIVLKQGHVITFNVIYFSWLLTSLKSKEYLSHIMNVVFFSQAITWCIYSYDSWFGNFFRSLFSWLPTLECSFHRFPSAYTQASCYVLDWLMMSIREEALTTLAKRLIPLPNISL